MRSKKRFYYIICNPASGKKRDKDDVLASLEKAIKEKKGRYESHKTNHRGHGAELSKDAVEKRADIVVVIGGDGTVNEVAKSLVGTNTILGIIPMGSGNGLARELGISQNPEEAIATLLEHKCLRMDACTVNDEYFFCTCGVGFDAEVSARFSERTQRGPAGYVQEVIDTFFKHEPLRCEIDVDGKKSTNSLFLLTCANASQYGNNAYIAPQADITDGIIDVTMIEEFSLVHSGQIAYQLFSKGLDKNPYTKQLRGKRIEIKLKDPVHFHVDGDPKPKTDHLLIEMKPQALNVIHGQYDKREQTILDIFFTHTNNYLEWKDGILEEVVSTLKGIGKKKDENKDEDKPKEIKG
ncbi:MULTISPECIES: diacylglycerol/lipid kinase family protein [Porphyromonas]|uniref:diacylglycerol/lipid kinase family protein n=1 Tax=Porphyromonas TaxID=836 RepID=UPI00068E771A|nr:MULTISPECIES: YegS/Rv2252/BmrU family lipid kinase [Porphyromonas]